MPIAALVLRVQAAVQTLGRRLAFRRQHPLDAGRFDGVLGMLERDAGLKERMLDELRDAARVGGASLNGSPHADFADVLRSAAESLVPLAREAGITLHARCAATSLIIAADPKDLTHIVSRLLACAMTHCKRGGTIYCQLSLDADWVTLAIRLQASDVEAGSVPGILESQGASAPDRDAAAWARLGLTTVRRLVTSYGGTVRVEIGSAGDSSFTAKLAGGANG
jgi:signal transduction histidine kinase